MELFFDHAGTDELFEGRDGHLEALLNLLGVGFIANEGVAVESGGKNLADAVGALLIADGDAEALGFVFDFLLKDELLEDLVGVETFELAGDGIVLANLVEALIDVREGDGLIANLGDHVAGSLRGVWALRHKIEEHAEREHADDDAEEDSDAGFLVIKGSSHSRCLLRG